MNQEEKIQLLKELAGGNGATINKQIWNVNMGDGPQYNYNGDAAEKADDETEEEPQHVTKEQMGRAIKKVQDMFWGQSSYAVIFCAMRDCFGYGDNASLFESDVMQLSRKMGLDYACPVNTISSAFYNNSYLKLNVEKWEQNNVKQRAVNLMNAFRNALETEVDDAMSQEEF